jgi:hypothetical protein
VPAACPDVDGNDVIMTLGLGYENGSPVPSAWPQKKDRILVIVPMYDSLVVGSIPSPGQYVSDSVIQAGQKQWFDNAR